MKRFDMRWKQWVVGVALGVGAVFAYAADPALVLYLGFDEADGQAMDGSGKNNHATLKGAASRGTGKYGSGLVLAPNAHAEVAHNDSLNLTNFTLMTWARIEKDTGDQQSAMEKGAGWVDGEYNLLGDYNNHVLLQIHDLDAACADTCEGGEIIDNQWHHIAGVWDGANIRTYIDGKLNKDCPCNGTMKANSDPLFIGARGGTVRWTQGAYDEIKIFSRPLTEAEIAAEMAFVTTAVEPNGKAAMTWGAVKRNVVR